MKQLIAILALVFTIHESKAQIYYARQVASATYSSYSNKYVWESPSYENIKFTVQGSKIYLDNQAASVYTISSKLVDNINSDNTHEIDYQATNRNGIPCVVKWYTYPDGSMRMYIQFSDCALLYVFI